MSLSGKIEMLAKDREFKRFLQEEKQEEPMEEPMAEMEMTPEMEDDLMMERM
jgi:hypothetical protein